MTSPATSAARRPLLQVGLVLVGLATLLALVTAVLVLAPAQRMKQRAENGSTVVVDVPAHRDWGVYSTLTTWRAAACDLTAADGRPIVLRPDMMQQNLYGWPTWYAQGSFGLDRGQRITASCVGPPGQFAVGPSAGFLHVVLVFVNGLLAALLAVTGLTLVIVAAVRQHRSSAVHPPRG